MSIRSQYSLQTLKKTLSDQITFAKTMTLKGRCLNMFEYINHRLFYSPGQLYVAFPNPLHLTRSALEFKYIITCCIPSLGWFPSVWILCADILDHPTCFIFIGCVRRLFLLRGGWRLPSIWIVCADVMEQKVCSATLAHTIQTPRNPPLK